MVRVVPYVLSGCANNNTVYAFLLGHLEFWYVLCRGSLCDQPRIKILGAESLMGFSGQKHHIDVAFFVVAERRMCSPPQERASRKNPPHGSLHTVSLPYDQLYILATGL